MFGKHINNKMYFIFNRKNVQQLLKQQSFVISFGEQNPFRKGEVIQSSTVTTKMIVVKVYDHIWWRKLLMKCRILKPLYLTKVRVIHD